MGQLINVSRLSENLDETHDGYLICKNVPIARAGELIYSDGETPVSSVDGITTINRSIEDLLDPRVIASFEMKPVTLDHPEDFVNSDTWKEFSIGTVYNVRQGEGEDSDKLVADLSINDREAIQAIKDGILRQVSCGYLAKFEETAPGQGVQTGMEGNHLAILKYGRCGAECSIKDAANDAIVDMQHKKYAVIDRLPDEIGKNMKQFKELFKKTTDAADDADKKDAESNDEMDLSEFMEKFTALAEMVGAHGERLSAVESNMMTADADADADKEEEKKVDDEDPDMKKEKSDDAEPFAKFSNMLEKILNAVVKTNDSGEKADGEKKEAHVSDSVTKSRAEILAPGIIDSKDIKERSLKEAYETKDGKEVIDTILSGQSFDSADKEMLFNASSALLKITRTGSEHTYTKSNDAVGTKTGFIKDKEFNANCAEAWSKIN